MARLALVAMLLLATLPTFGRLLATRADTAASAWTALCTASGLQYVGLELAGGERSAPGVSHDAGIGVPAPSGHSDPDCAYCPLLASFALAIAWLALALVRGAAPRLCTWRHVRARKPLHPSGLGSRGPPFAL
jgi:hypothetical protein